VRQFALNKEIPRFGARRRFMKALLSALLLATVFPLALAPRVPAQLESNSSTVQVQAILKKHCAQCHGDGGTRKGGMNYILDRELLVERGQVTPGDLDKSPLWQRIAKGEMPPEKQPRPSSDDLAVLKRWILEQAPAMPIATGNQQSISASAVIGSILGDLESLPPKQRKFTRYFTVSHLLNAGKAEKEIATTKLALGKLLNSLSWHPRLAVPVPIGPGVYRADLRHYKWNASSWERLVREYPYRSGPDAEQKKIALWTETDLPAIRADWFIATASRPPLYHDLLQLPSTDRALERLLQVEVMQNLQDECAVRAGFNDSGVSKNNRIIERHDAVYGAYWRSYDFSDNKARQSIFEHPLGPTSGTTSFKQAGGEMIFHLPNGLHGYLIVDGQGRRLDKAPVEIVSDPQRPDQRVETGLSCMSCHARGVLPRADQVRGHALKNKQAFDASVFNTVLALYPPKEALQKLIDEDNVRYGHAVDKLGLALDIEDPVNVVARRFEAPLDVNLASAESGVDIDTFRRMLMENADLAKSLGTLAVQGGTVLRDVFDDAFPALNGLVAKAHGAVLPARPASVYSAQDPGNTHCLATSSNGELAAAGQDRHSLIVFEADNGSIRMSLDGHRQEVTALAFSPQASWLASGSADRTIRTWDLTTGKVKQELLGHTDRVRCLAFSPDAWYLVSGSDDRSLRLWGHLDGKEVHSFMGHEGPVLAAAWAPDGKWFVSAGQDGTLRRWDVVSGQEVFTAKGHVGAAVAVAVSPDCKAILSGGTDRTVRLWDAATGKQCRQWTDHVNSIIAVAFTETSAIGMSSQYRQSDALVRVWDLSSGKEERRWAEDSTVTISTAVLAPGGHFAITGGASSTLKRWQGPKR
jgi:mono/diheme cytochrome c family protein